jgi:Fe-S oxidoreductase
MFINGGILMKYDDIVHRCFRCGFCKLTSDFSNYNCPTYSRFRFESSSPGGRLWLIRAWLAGDVKTSEHFGEILYSCTACGNCVEHCIFTFSENIVDIYIAAREKMVEQSVIPPAVRDYLKNVSISGNPYKAPAAERGKWADGTGIPKYENQEYLFYVGDVGSYDERGMKMARAVGRLLHKAGVDIGILAENELCDGNEVRSVGETGLFELLAEQNSELFRSLGVKKIITLDPHAFNAFKNCYPFEKGEFEIYHYTQILAPLLKSGQVSLKGGSAKITYHDPCYLGRYNREYAAPREILNAVSGLELVEMERNREDAFCCGGGGGNFFTDLIGGGANSPARIRIREAVNTGADIVATACPQCAKMLDDAAKAEGLEGRLEIRDIAEIISDYC